MMLGTGEPDLGPWTVVGLDEFVARLPFLVALDGRGSSGKSALTSRIAARVPGAVVVHTDDIAWHHAAFDWADMLVTGVLEPVRRGEPVSFRPPQWEARGRAGAIEVPAGAPLVLVEGVGSARRELAGRYDEIVYVQSDVRETDRRNQVKCDAGETNPADLRSWMAEEIPFVAADRPWERAGLIVTGTPDLPHDPQRQVVISSAGR